MSNGGKSEVNTSNARNDESCNSGKKCEVQQTETIVTVTSNGKSDRMLNKVKCCGEQTMHTIPDVKLSMCDLSEANPEFLISTIKELQRKIEYTEKMNWLCKFEHRILFYGFSIFSSDSMNKVLLILLCCD